MYSLGLSLFEAMTGQVLFPQETAQDALAARLETENVSPAARMPTAGIDPDLDELVVQTHEQLSLRLQDCQGAGARFFEEVAHSASPPRPQSRVQSPSRARLCWPC